MSVRVRPVQSEKPEPASPRKGDAGFTLIEVVVGILLIGAAMLTIVVAASNGIFYQGMSRVRQNAGGVANQVMEQLRSLPRETIVRGLADMGLKDDPHLDSTCDGGVLRLISCEKREGESGSGEVVIRCGGDCLTAQPPPLRPNTAEVTLDGVEYTWHAYITDPNTDGDDTKIDNPLRITVWVDWDWRGYDYDTRIQSFVAFPLGCAEEADFLVGPPCGTGVGDTGGGDALTVAVSWGSGATARSFGVSFGSVSTGFQTEEPLTASADATNPDGTSAAALADLDDASGPDESNKVTATMPSLASPFVFATSPTREGVPPADVSVSSVRVRFYKPPEGVGVGGIAMPQAKAVAVASGASATDCTGTEGALGPCVLARSWIPGVSKANDGIALEFVTATGYVYTLARIPAGNGLCGTNCFWSNEALTCYQGGIPGGGLDCLGSDAAGTTLTSYVFRKVPRVLIGGRSTECDRVPGDLPLVESGCRGFVAEVVGVCDNVVGYLRSASVPEPPSPLEGVASCNVAPRGTYGGTVGTKVLPAAEASGPSLTAQALSTWDGSLTRSAHRASFTYLATQFVPTSGPRKGSQCETTYPETWEVLTNDLAGWTWPAAPRQIQWCNRGARTLWRVTVGTQGWQFARGSLSAGWTSATTLTYRYEVLKCPVEKTDVECEKTANYSADPNFPAGGITVSVTFPRFTLKPSVYDTW